MIALTAAGSALCVLASVALSLLWRSRLTRTEAVPLHWSPTGFNGFVRPRTALIAFPLIVTVMAVLGLVAVVATHSHYSPRASEPADAGRAASPGPEHFTMFVAIASTAGTVVLQPIFYRHARS